MDLLRRWASGYLGLAACTAVRCWMSTLDYKVRYDDPAVDPALPICRGSKIYLFWHEYLMFPFYLRRHCNLALLVSRHRDAEVLSQAARLMGFELVRGSTQRGGIAAVRQLLRRGHSRHLAITPDGPRGPRRRLASGPIFLASRLQLPLVPLGFGYDRFWRTPTWDRFAIPKPYARARCVAGREIHVPRDLQRWQLERFRHDVEVALNQYTARAEAWAASGLRYPDECPVACGPQRRPARRIDRAHCAAVLGPSLAVSCQSIGAVDD